jgi:antitoxin YobK
MGMKELNNAYELLKENDGSFFKGKIDESLIIKAEKFLEVKFPKTYRYFLEHSGCGSFCSKEFYGISSTNFENSTVPNGIWLTNNARKNFNLDKNLIIIGQSIEGYYVLDTSKMDGNYECPVFDWHAGADIKNLELIAEDFGTFFLNEINEVIS